MTKIRISGVGLRKFSNLGVHQVSNISKISGSGLDQVGIIFAKLFDRKCIVRTSEISIFGNSDVIVLLYL